MRAFQGLSYSCGSPASEATVLTEVHEETGEAATHAMKLAVAAKAEQDAKRKQARMRHYTVAAVCDARHTQELDLPSWRGTTGSHWPRSRTSHRMRVI